MACTNINILVLVLSPLDCSKGLRRLSFDCLLRAGALLSWERKEREGEREVLLYIML